jgi:hypothetical protein
MKERDNSGIALVIILIILFLLPIGWIFLAYPAESFHPVKGEPLREAAQAAGLTVVNSTDVLWPLSGATGGKIYVLEDYSGNTLAVQTQTFDSVQSRDVAIQTYYAQTIGRGKPGGFLVVKGQQVIFVAPDQVGNLNRLVTELRRQQYSG